MVAARRQRAPRDRPSKVADPLTHPTVVELAEKYGKTPAQVVLSWHTTMGSRPSRSPSGRNASPRTSYIFDFALTAAEMAAIDTPETRMRCGPDPEVAHAKTFPITLED
jgi:diketogulonate reductase-like aldo/keto reductase